MSHLSPAHPPHIHHVGVAVSSIASAAAFYELLTGTRCSRMETIEAQGVDVAFVGAIELLQPRDPESPVGRFLARRGPGLHHVAYAVPDLPAELARLEAAGVELIDREPRRGAAGHLVAFVHPRSAGGVLVELVEEGKERG